MDRYGESVTRGLFLTVEHWKQISQQRRKTTCNVPFSDVECYAAVKKQITATQQAWYWVGPDMRQYVLYNSISKKLKGGQNSSMRIAKTTPWWKFLLEAREGWLGREQEASGKLLIFFTRKSKLQSLSHIQPLSDFIKFHWDTVTAMPSRTIFGCFLVTLAELSSCHRDCMAHEA